MRIRGLVKGDLIIGNRGTAAYLAWRSHVMQSTYFMRYSFKLAYQLLLYELPHI